MKSHISPKQAKEISETEFYGLFEQIVPRDDWAHYHHKKMDIAKMIGLIDEVTIGKSVVNGLWNVFTLDENNFEGKELADALWEAVKHTHD